MTAFVWKFVVVSVTVMVAPTIFAPLLSVSSPTMLPVYLGPVKNDTRSPNRVLLFLIYAGIQLYGTIENSTPTRLPLGMVKNDILSGRNDRLIALEIWRRYTIYLCRYRGYSFMKLNKLSA